MSSWLLEYRLRAGLYKYLSDCFTRAIEIWNDGQGGTLAVSRRGIAAGISQRLNEAIAFAGTASGSTYALRDFRPERL